MINKSFFPLIFLLSIVLIIIPYIAFSSSKDRPNSIKLVPKFESIMKSSDKELCRQMQALAAEMENRAKLYKTTNQKVYWENEAKKSFLKLLHSEGYYEATIETELAENENSIFFHITGFERYKIKKIRIRFLPGSNDKIKMPDSSKLKLDEGDFAVASKILNAQRKLEKHIEMQNCLLSLEITHEAMLDSSDDTANINFIVNAGSQAQIKSVNVKGLKEVDAQYVRKLIPLKEGQCFKKSYIRDAQAALQRSGLFAITTPEIPDHTDKDGEVPVVFNLKERKHRTLKAGLSYGSDLGFGATIGWDHKNLFGSGELLKSEIFANQKDQTVEFTFSKPFYKRDDQTLKIGLYGENISSKAYENKEGALSAGLERKLNNIWTASASGKYSYSIIKENNKPKNFSYFSVPLFIKRDTRDDILNTKGGNELTFKYEPFRGIREASKSFNKTEIDGSAYLYFRNAFSFKPLIALQASAGSISGAKFSEIPANEKFYVGGIGSVRGYAYQLAGEVNDSKRPVGGRSFIQTNLELRFKLKGDLGGVIFLDNGNVYKSTTPEFKKKMYQGAGFGVRYYTDFGPLRADIGFPLKRRKFIDKTFQIYFGIGQNF